MKIRNVVHSGLRSLISEDEPAGPRSIDVSRLRCILSFLQDMAGESELRCVAGWTVQLPPGSGRGRWELRAAPVGALSFRIDAQGGEIADLDYEGTAETWAQAQ
jgi:proteic killer suppression protein